MSAVFADTSFYLAYVNPRDGAHGATMEFVRQFRGETVTSEYVLVEVGNSLARSADRRVFLDLLRDLRADRHASIVPATHALFEAGANLYARRADKEWSMTDCISFAVMRQEGLTEALTTDRHFEQAGFRVVLH